MSFKMERVHVWTGEVEDRPGGAAAILAKLAHAGADLEYIFTQRLLDKPGSGILFVAPITGHAHEEAARAVGLRETDTPIVHRIEGDNSAGLAHRLTQHWAEEGISFQGLTLSAIADKFIGYVAFDSVADANRAAQILAEEGNGHTVANA
ncbi:MAG: amino acid-binding ACT [Gemmataceae bacterium]